MTRVLITTIPAQDVTRPPGILSILAACCESIDADYAIKDLNLYMYKTVPEKVVTELLNDFVTNKFRSKDNTEYYRQVAEHYVQEIKLYQPTHIAISIFTYASILAADYLLKYIKNSQIDHKFKIVLGGLGLSNSVDDITGIQTFGEYCLSTGLADYCVYGEGDIAFVELLKGNTNYPGINKTNQEQILNLDLVPIPSYNKINPNEYFHAGHPEILITGSRGCVRDCSFCDVASYWEKYVFKSGEQLAQEVFKTWKTTGVQKFDFSDSLINGSLKTFRQFNKAIIQLKAEHPEFTPLYEGQFICRPKGTLKELDYQEMALAGAQTLVVGIESFSESVRTHMRKHFDNAAIDWHFEMCAKYGIKNVLLLLTGYVTETLEDHQTTLDYLQKYQVYALSRTIYAIQIAADGMMVLKGSPIHNDVHEIGLVFENNETTGSRWTNLSNPTLTKKERLRRGVEVILTAYSVGFKVLNFDMKLGVAERKYTELLQDQEKPIFKLEPVR